MLYSTKEIAEMYGGENRNITPYTITQTWIPLGLKHIRGKANSYLFKKEGVEEFLETQIIIKENKQKTLKIRRQSVNRTNVKCFVV